MNIRKIKKKNQKKRRKMNQRKNNQKKKRRKQRKMKMKKKMMMNTKKKKGPNPLDALPPSKFSVDDWKRKFLNSKEMPAELAWFW